jgi:hypothetical protein
MLAELDMSGGAGLGFISFRGTPRPPGRVGRVRAAEDYSGAALWAVLAMHDTPNAVPRLGCAIDNRKWGGVGSQPFGGAPDSAAEGDRVSATGNSDQARPRARSGAGPSNPSAGTVPQRSARHPQPAPPPDSRQPKLSDRAHDALRVRSHRVPATPVTVHRRAQRDRAIRGQSGIPDPTLLKQKRTLGSNVPHHWLGEKS